MSKELIKVSDNTKDNIKDTQKELFFLKKIEKLTSALYKVTDSMYLEEPLRWKMRNEALTLLSSSMSFINHWQETTSRDLSVILHDISRLSSFLEVSYMGSLVSQMNFKVLKSEYDALHDSIRTYKEEREVTPHLGVMDREIELKGQFYEDEKNKRTFVRDSNGNFESSILSPGNFFKVDHLGTSRTNYGQKTNYKKSDSVKNNLMLRVSYEARSTEDKKNRRAIIMSFIKKEGREIGIKDIFGLPELSKFYSEKTIQRELVDMVNNGVLKKSGERRWSRYSL